VLGHINTGKLRAYAVTTAARSQVAPNIPTMAEAGLPGVQANLRFVIMAPRGTPPAIIRMLHAAVADSMRDAELRALLIKQGFEPLATTPEETDKTMRQDHERWKPLLKAANIRLE